jgi:hypothetical protein
VRRSKKRDFIAACYRTHGPSFIRLVRQRFLETGTETNLLADIRAMPTFGTDLDERRVEVDYPRSAWDPDYGEDSLV